MERTGMARGVGMVTVCLSLCACTGGVEGALDTNPTDDMPMGPADGPGNAFPVDLLPDRIVPELKPISPPHGGRALFTEIVHLEPGDDVTYCTFIDDTTDAVTYIHDTLGTQSRYGHHVVLFYAPEPEQPGTRACGSMEKYRQILGGSGGETADENGLPGNVVSEIPAGVQLVLNHHWINYGEEPMDVQAMLITVPPDSLDDLVIARSMVVLGLGWELLPGVHTEHTVECEFPQDVPAVAVLGHEHELGTWVKAERQTPDGRVDVLFDHAFLPEYANNPERFYYPLDAPLMFHAGDKLRFTCQWMNDTAERIKFPREMCVLFANTLTDTDMTCANGNWVAQP